MINKKILHQIKHNEMALSLLQLSPQCWYLFFLLYSLYDPKISCSQSLILSVILLNIHVYPIFAICLENYIQNCYLNIWDCVAWLVEIIASSILWIWFTTYLLCSENLAWSVLSVSLTLEYISPIWQFCKVYIQLSYLGSCTDTLKVRL